MRKFVRIALLVCAVVAAIPILLFGLFWVWIWYETRQVESFYREHPLLGKMRSLQASSTNDSGPARQALLEIAPLGTEKEAAIAILRKEGLGCKTIAEPITATKVRQSFMTAMNSGQPRRDFTDCQTMSPGVFGPVQWIVNLEFDAQGRLSEAGVAMWYISL